MAIERVDGKQEVELVGWAFENSQGQLEKYVASADRIEIYFDNEDEPLNTFYIEPEDIDNMIIVLQKAKEYFNGQR